MNTCTYKFYHNLKLPHVHEFVAIKSKKTNENFLSHEQQKKH